VPVSSPNALSLVHVLPSVNWGRCPSPLVPRRPFCGPPNSKSFLKVFFWSLQIFRHVVQQACLKFPLSNLSRSGLARSSLVTRTDHFPFPPLKPVLLMPGGSHFLFRLPLMLFLVPLRCVVMLNPVNPLIFPFVLSHRISDIYACWTL